jgi:hypothetical protein
VSANRTIALDFALHINEILVSAGKRIWGGENEVIIQVNDIQAFLDSGVDGQFLWLALRLLRLNGNTTPTTSEIIDKAKQLAQT